MQRTLDKYKNILIKKKCLDYLVQQIESIIFNPKLGKFQTKSKTHIA
jgi:hypothetical protein